MFTLMSSMESTSNNSLLTQIIEDQKRLSIAS